MICAGLLLLLAISRVAAEEEDDEYAVEEEEEEEEDTAKAMLVVRKWLKDDTIVEGGELVVRITIYNQGTSTAGEIRVKDNFPEDKFTLKEGSKTLFTLERLSAGSEETFEYLLLPKSTGPAALDRAKVNYLLTTDGKPQKQICRSSTATALILTTQDNIIRSILVAGSYATLGTLKTTRQWQTFGGLLLVIVILVGGNWAWVNYSTARKNRQRERALKALQKSE